MSVRSACHQLIVNTGLGVTPAVNDRVRVGVPEAVYGRDDLVGARPPAETLNVLWCVLDADRYRPGATTVRITML